MELWEECEPADPARCEQGPPSIATAVLLTTAQGCNWVVMVKLADEAALEAYLPHPEHVKVKELQGPLVEDIFVCDLHV